MSELTVTIIKVGFLALIWLFIISAVAVMRADLFGTRVGRARDAAAGGAVPAVAGADALAAAPKPARTKPAKPTKPAKSRKGQPTQAVVVAGNGAGTAVRLVGETVMLGRGPECELTVDDEYISTRHAVFRQHEGIWYAEDLGSTNGTFVDGARIHGPTEVRIGSVVRLGKTTLELRT